MPSDTTPLLETRLPSKASDGEAAMSSFLSPSRKIFLALASFALLFVAVSHNMTNSAFETASTDLSTDDDDSTGTVVNLLIRSYTSEEACEEDGAGLLGTFRNISFVTGKCSAYSAYNLSKDEGSINEPGYFEATCSDNVITLTSYGTDSTCTTAVTSDDYEGGEDTCVENDEVDGVTDMGYTRYYVSNCDGSEDDAIIQDWLDYSNKHSELDEIGVILTKAAGERQLYHQVAQDLGLEPSERAIKQAKRMYSKLSKANDDMLHPLIKKMSVSPYTWELVLRTHEGTKESRENYKATEDLHMKTDTSLMQEAWKNTMRDLQQEKFDREAAGSSSTHLEKIPKKMQGVGGHKGGAQGEEMWFWDDWFGDDGDDIIENLDDDEDILDWDDSEYDAMPSITLHVGFSGQVLWVVATATVDVAINTDLIYSVGATVGAGTSSDWFSAEVEYTSSCTFMFDICYNPGDSIALGITAGAAYAFVSVEVSVATIWSNPDYDLLGIDFAFDTGVDLTGASSIDIAVELLFCTTVMPFNARDVRKYCNPKEYEGNTEKDAPWTLTSWDDDFWGWDGRRRLGSSEKTIKRLGESSAVVKYAPTSLEHQLDLTEFTNYKDITTNYHF